MIRFLRKVTTTTKNLNKILNILELINTDNDKNKNKTIEI